MSQQQNNNNQQPPQMRQDFKETQPDRELDEKKKKDLQNTETVTKQQVQALEAQRPTPQMQTQLTPGGAVEQSVHSQEECARQNKVEEMKRKLNTARQNMRKSFTRSR